MNNVVMTEVLFDTAQEALERVGKGLCDIPDYNVDFSMIRAALRVGRVSAIYAAAEDESLDEETRKIMMARFGELFLANGGVIVSLNIDDVTE